MLRFRPILYSLLALAVALPVVQAELVWRPGEGWSDESGSDVSASSSHDQLELAHKLEAQGQRDDALKAYKTLLRRWPLSFFAPEAQYRMGKILEDEADFAAAFKAFQVMVQKYPSSDYFDQALNEQYRIANLYLAGEPQRVWKIPVGPSMDKTVEMYDRIIKNAPYGAYAAQCQFNIGLAREHQRKFPDAIDAYQKVIDNYSGSSVASNAQYQIGYVWMTSSFQGDYDMGAARKAIDAFQDFLVRYPDSDKAVQAQDNIKKMGQRQTQGAFDIAKFYERQHTNEGSRAAFIYYNEVIREDPNSADAQIAKKRVNELRTLLQALPGGLGPDGTGSLANPQTLASNPNGGPVPTTPDPGPLPGNLPPPDPTTTVPLPSDPNAPVTGSSPGATAANATTPGDVPTPPSTNAAPDQPVPPPAPSDQPASLPALPDAPPAPSAPTPPTPADSTPAPAPAPAAPSDSTPAPAPASPAPAAPSDSTSAPAPSTPTPPAPAQ